MTYDIEMYDDGPHNFIANGLVSHNSHSVAYGFTTYRTAWLKCHYPAQFAGAVIDNVLDKPDEILRNFIWMKNIGLDIRNPCINRSDIRTVTGEKSVQLPLHLVKGIGEDMARRIIDEREKHGKYTSVVNFINRNNTNVRDVTIMAKAGCFDVFGANRAAVVRNAEILVSEAKQQNNLNDISNSILADVMTLTEIDDTRWVNDDAAPDTWVENGVLYNTDITLYAVWEKESMGVLVGEHPFSILKEYVSGAKLINTYPPITTFHQEHKLIKSVGYITGINNRVYTDKRGNKKPMCRFMVETDEGTVPGVIFDTMPETIHDNSFVYVEGKLTNNNRDNSDATFVPDLVAYAVKPIKMDLVTSGEKVHKKTRTGGK